jgi:hypothetical protein
VFRALSDSIEQVQARLALVIIVFAPLAQNDSVAGVGGFELPEDDFAEQLIKCRRKGPERTHFLPNSAGISVRWTNAI